MISDFKNGLLDMKQAMSKDLKSVNRPKTYTESHRKFILNMMITNLVLNIITVMSVLAIPFYYSVSVQMVWIFALIMQLMFFWFTSTLGGAYGYAVGIDRETDFEDYLKEGDSQ